MKKKTERTIFKIAQKILEDGYEIEYYIKLLMFVNMKLITSKLLV
jgi:hypothetical protein